MFARKFTVLLEPAEEGGFIVKSVELPVASQGEIKEEALSNIKEAIEGYLEVKAKLLNKKTKGEKAEVIVEAPSADNERVACGDNRRGWVKKGRISTAS
jgi:predicted RNase H-like HicB family nuclease